MHEPAPATLCLETQLLLTYRRTSSQQWGSELRLDLTFGNCLLLPMAFAGLDPLEVEFSEMICPVSSYLVLIMSGKIRLMSTSTMAVLAARIHG